jgi:signal transduction histidine kinase
MLFLVAFIAVEAVEHFWLMGAFGMTTYHLLSFLLDAGATGVAIGYVWWAAGRANTTMRQKNEQLACLAEELRRTEGMKDQLTAMVVHDLRSPLTGLMGGLQMMAAQPRAGSLGRLWEYHGLAQASAQRMARLVDHLLDITRLESNEMRLELAPLSVVPLLAEAVEQSRLGAESQQARIELHVDEGLPSVSGDRQLLLRVLDNLIGNALKFTPEGSAVQLRARAAQLPAGGPGVAITVSDDGPGIPPAYHRRIFDKFGIVEDRQTSTRPSTGLGLAFCRLAVEAHGGYIGVESEEGAGSTFSVTLSAHHTEPAPPDDVAYRDRSAARSCDNTEDAV